MQKLLDVLAEELCSVCLSPPSHAELERLKFRYLFDLEVLHESHSRLISREVSQLFLETPLTLKDECEIVKSITPDQVLTAAQRILTHHRQTVVLVGPRARKFRSPIEKFLDQLNRCGG
jgi:predicted Zn-dependent peptidase